MRTVPAAVIGTTLAITGGILPHVAPAAWDPYAIGMLFAGMSITIAAAIRHACQG